jgi:hypothetical protein
MKLVNGGVGYCVDEIISFAAKQWLPAERRMELIRLDAVPRAISEVRRVAFTPITTQISATTSCAASVAASKRVGFSKQRAEENIKT